MTLMLARVANPREAEIAVRHGTDMVGLDDAAMDARAVADPALVRATVEAMGSWRPVGAAIGKEAMESNALLAAATAMADAGANFIEVLLFPGPRRDDCIRALSSLARRVRILGVVFANNGADEQLISLMAQNSFHGAMLDIGRKIGGRIFDTLDITALRKFSDVCRAHGLKTGFTGALEAPDVPRLLLLEPDILGFDDALCASEGEETSINPEAVKVVRALIPLDVHSVVPRDDFSEKIDYRLLTARGQAPGVRRDETESDRIFVRDFVLPVSIGAYAHERNKPQNVRFNVDVRVLRPDHVAADIRDVFSYDVIIDGIRMIVAQDHIPLVETLAERIAALILAHPRVIKATVRVEKLDIGPGGVGVEITRERLAEAAKVHQLYPAASDKD
jgi:dihydroneopterin aldolase